MARTFKQYGCAHDTSGSLNVVVTVGGTEVYNGSVTADTEPHNESPLGEELLFSFELDDSVSGDTAWEVTVTGSEGAQLCLGPLTCNNITSNMTIPLNYFVDKMVESKDDVDASFNAEAQQYMATTLGGRLDADVRARLEAGTSVPSVDADHIMAVNEEEGVDADTFYPVTRTLSNIQLNGEAVTVNPGGWPEMSHNDTLTMTANLELLNFAYQQYMQDKIDEAGL